MSWEKQPRQHYFPQIPLQFVQGEENRGGNSQRFQRLHSGASEQFEGQDGACRPNAFGAGAAPASDLNSIESEAYAKGFCKGEQDGRQAAAERVQQAIDSLAEAAAGLTRLQQSLARKSEARLVELALAIGRKIVGYEIAANRHVVVNIARQALKSVGNLQEVTLKMNPTDLQFLEENQVPLPELATHIRKVNFEAVVGIESGGCVIESPCGVVDAQIDNQLQRIEQAFRAELDKITESESDGMPN